MRWRGKSVVFDDHHAASFPTMPARHDYLTGYPAYTNQDWGPLPHGLPTVTAALSRAGYVTAAVVDTPFYMSRGFHYHRGFQYFYDMMSQPFEAPPYDARSQGYDLTRTVPPKGFNREGWAASSRRSAIARRISLWREPCGAPRRPLELLKSNRFFALVERQLTIAEREVRVDPFRFGIVRIVGASSRFRSPIVTGRLISVTEQPSALGGCVSGG